MLGPADIDRVELLLAHTEIRQLPYRYAYANDFRDADLLLSLWSEAVDPAPLPGHRHPHGAAEHERWFRKGPTVHFIGNHIIELDSADRAHGSVYCMAQLDFGEQFIDQSILYQDTYVRERDTWLFERRGTCCGSGRPAARIRSIRRPTAGPGRIPAAGSSR